MCVYKGSFLSASRTISFRSLFHGKHSAAVMFSPWKPINFPSTATWWLLSIDRLSHHCLEEACIPYNICGICKLKAWREVHQARANVLAQFGTRDARLFWGICQLSKVSWSTPWEGWNQLYAVTPVHILMVVTVQMLERVILGKRRKWRSVLILLQSVEPLAGGTLCSPAGYLVLTFLCSENPVCLLTSLCFARLF